MIKNLVSQLNEAGKIKIGKKGKMITSKGGKEFRPPQKLDHFQITTTEKDENGDYIIDHALQNKLLRTGIVNNDENLIGIPVRLIYNDVDKNFPNRYVSYVSGRLSCHGDGEKSKKRIDEFEKDHKCPCQRINQGYTGKDKCKATGTLMCVIDEAGLFGQAHTFRTTSMNSIKGIIGGIELLNQATGGKIAWLPLMLTLNEKNTTTPEGHNTKIYVVSLCFRGNIEDLRGEVLKLIETDKQYLIEMDATAKNPVPETNTEDEQDFVEEFFPSQIDKDSCIDVVSETVGEEIQEDFVEKTEDDNRVKEETSHDGSEKPVAEYVLIYDKFLAEKDFDKAVALSKRLKKGNLIYWLVNNRPDVKFKPTAGKPTILKIVEYVLKEMPSGHEVDDEKETTEEELKMEEKQAVESNEPIEYVAHWDMSDPITVEQKRMLVKLKEKLENTKDEEGDPILYPGKWVNHVNFFKDKEGKDVSSANVLTTRQGDTFIRMLTDALPEGVTIDD